MADTSRPVAPGYICDFTASTYPDTYGDMEREILLEKVSIRRKGVSVALIGFIEDGERTGARYRTGVISPGASLGEVVWDDEKEDE